MPTRLPAPPTTEETRPAGPAPVDPASMPASLDEALGQVVQRIALLPTTEPRRPELTSETVGAAPAPIPVRSWLPRLAVLGVSAVASWAAVVALGAGIWSAIS